MRPAPFSFNSPLTWGLLSVVAVTIALYGWRQYASQAAIAADAAGTRATENGGTVHKSGSLPHQQDSSADGSQETESEGETDVPEYAAPDAIASGGLDPDQARALVHSLFTFNFGPDLSVRQTMDRWRAGLAQLGEGGVGAVPSISEFLSLMQDIDLARIPETATLGHPSLRLALIDALGQIGGPEAESALLNALKQTADPREIAQLAKVLNQLSPDAYRDEMLAASREAFQLIQSGQMAGQDVAPLYEVFRTFGDEGIAQELLENPGDWQYYALLAAAGMPSGIGLPALIENMNGSDPLAGGTADFAFRLLAQAALESGEASRALLEQAQSGRIPKSAWEGIAEAVAGYEARLQSAFLNQDLTALDTGSGVRSYQIAAGNQSYFTAPVAYMTPAEIEDRLELLDGLLAVATDPTSLAGLRSRREQLAAQVAGP